jgi:hypothetical protein
MRRYCDFRRAILEAKGKNMKLTELLLAQLERETEGTRNAVKRVPEGRNDWAPHDKSMKLGYLAGLVASMPAWIEAAIRTRFPKTS